MAFKELPGGTAARPPLKSLPQAPGTANINPTVSVGRPPVLPGLGLKPTVAVPNGSGKSASAPGQIKKIQGLKSASSLVRKNPDAEKPDGKADALKGAARRMSTMPQPAIRYAKQKKAPKAADRNSIGPVGGDY